MKRSRKIKREYGTKLDFPKHMYNSLEFIDAISEFFHYTYPRPVNVNMRIYGNLDIEGSLVADFIEGTIYHLRDKELLKVEIMDVFSPHILVAFHYDRNLELDKDTMETLQDLAKKANFLFFISENKVCITQKMTPTTQISLGKPGRPNYLLIELKKAFYRRILNPNDIFDDNFGKMYRSDKNTFMSLDDLNSMASFDDLDLLVKVTYDADENKNK